MKIVHCLWSLQIGGTESMLVDIMNHQAKSHDVVVVVINNICDPMLEGKLSPNIKVVKIGRPVGSKNPWHIARLNLTLHGLRADVVHLHQPNIPKYIYFHPGKVYVLTCHSIYKTFEWIHRVDERIAISHIVAKEIEDNTNLSTVVIPNGINDEAALLRDERMPDDIFRMVQVGRLDIKTKGQDILIKAANILKNEFGRKFSIDIVGDGDDMPLLKRLVEEHHLGDCVNLVGAKDRDWIFQHLKDYDLMTHPARSEGFGLVVAEAMAAKLPVLATTQNGPCEIVENGKYGFIFDLGDDNSDQARNTAIAIANVMDNYEAALNKANLGLDHVRALYSVKHQADSYTKLYAKILEKNSY